MFTPAYQSDSRAFAWLRDQIMAPISRIPPAPAVLAALVSGQIGAPLGTMRAAPHSHSMVPGGLEVTS
jgi:hypothetical protein